MTSSFHVLDPWKTHPPVIDLEQLPTEMQTIARTLSGKDSQRDVVKTAYEMLSQKYRGYRFFTFLRIDRLFITNLSTLWNIRGFLHCHHINYLLRTLLVASGKFSTEDIASQWTKIWLFSPHQYLAIKLSNNELLNIDLWGKVYGIPFGNYAHGFHSGTLIASE